MLSTDYLHKASLTSSYRTTLFDQCTRDADLMKTLGANSIRVYHVDPRANQML